MGKGELGRRAGRATGWPAAVPLTQGSIPHLAGADGHICAV